VSPPGLDPRRIVLKPSVGAEVDAHRLAPARSDEGQGLDPGLAAREAAEVHRRYVHSDGATKHDQLGHEQGIISAVPGVDGLSVIAGFSGHGFMHGPIAGQLCLRWA